MDFSCTVVSRQLLSSESGEHFIATTTKLLYVIWITSEAPPPHISYFIKCGWSEFITRTLRMGNDISPSYRQVLSTSLNTCRGIGTETSVGDNVFSDVGNIYLIWTYRDKEYCFCTYPHLRYFCPRSYFRMMGWKNTTDLLYVRFTWWIKANPLECSRLKNWFSQSGLGFGWITCLLSGDSLVGIYFWKTVGFYQRPVLASGYCRCLHLFVRQSVRHQVCPRDYSSS